MSHLAEAPAGTVSHPGCLHLFPVNNMPEAQNPRCGGHRDLHLNPSPDIA